MFCRLSLTVILLLAVLPALPQATTARITGRVTDPLQAPVPGAQIRVTNVDTGVSRETQTDETGSYAVPLLQPGNYRLTVNQSGFRPVSQSGLSLAVDQTARLDIELQLGSVSEEVEVVASAPLLAQDTSSLGQIVDNAKIQNIPLNGRSAFRLVQLTPGLLAAPGANGQFGDIPVNTNQDTNFSINGGRNNSNEILIDGVPSTAGFFNSITTIPSIEATQEFKVQSNSLSAEWGRFSGGVVNVSTRSGTNALHGSIYEYFRNSVFDANEFFNNMAGREIPNFVMNQFGGAVGGPVSLGKLYSGRNRTFFFADYQGTRWSRGDVFRTSVPTAAQRAGDFSQTFTQAGQPVTIYDPLTTTRVGETNNYTRSAFPNNRIPEARISPIATALLAYYPGPNTAGDPFTEFNNFISNATRTIGQNQFSGRVDHNWNDAYRMFVRFSRNTTNLTQPDSYSNVATPEPGAVGTTPFTQTTVAWDNNITLSSNSILSLKYGLARWEQFRETRSYGFDQRTLGFSDSLVSQFQIPVFPLINVEQYGSLGGQSYFANGNDTHSLLASWTKLAGKHSLKAGADIRVRRINFINIFAGGGQYQFNRTITRGPNPLQFTANAGNAVASLLLGYPNGGNAPVQAGVSLQGIYSAFYFQDDIRITNNFTLNVGIRQETESPFTERRNQINYFDVDIASPARNAQFPDLQGGLVFASEANRQAWKWDVWNIAPRLGFAWTVTPKTVLRGGGGAFFAPAETSNSATGFTSSSGYSSATPVLGTLDGGLTPNVTLDNPFPGGLIPPTRDSLGASTFLGQAVTVWDAGPLMPVTWQWNFNVQRELPGSVLVDVSYAGSRGIHLAYRNRQINDLDPRHLSLGAGLNQLVGNPFYGTITAGALAQPTVQRRQLLLPFPHFTNVNIINMTSANSIYHSMQAKVERRFVNGFTALLSYTYGKLITDSMNQIAPIGMNANATGTQNWYDLSQERGVAELDVTHNLVFSFVAELPFGRGKALFSDAGRVSNALIGGWQLNGITSYRTGLPIAFGATIPGGGNRPNSTGISANISEDRSRGEAISRWFDTNQFLQPASFTLGNVGRVLSDVRGPRMFNQDLSLIKNTSITERVTLQLRFEYFNVFNRPTFAQPNATLGSGLFGQINSTLLLPRVGQVAAKINF